MIWVFRVLMSIPGIVLFVYFTPGMDPWYINMCIGIVSAMFSVIFIRSLTE